MSFFSKKRINLSGKGLKDDAIEEVARTIKRSRDITELALGCNSIGDKGCLYLSAVLPDTRIQELRLYKNRIDCEGAKHLGQCLKNTEIHHLDLMYNKLGDEGAANLAQGLEGSNVRDLDLRDNDIGPRGAFNLCQVLPRTRIQTLDLSRNRIGNEGAKFLGQCLKFTQISNLYFGNNGMEDEGLVNFVQGLPISKIKVLDLSGSNFGDDSLRSFANALKDTQIRGIRLDGIGTDAARYLHGILHESKLEEYRLGVSTSKSLNCIHQVMGTLDGIRMLFVSLSKYDIGIDGAEYLNELFQKFRLLKFRLFHGELKADQVQCLSLAFESIKIDCLFLNRDHLVQINGIQFLVEIFKNSQISRIDINYMTKPSEFQCLAAFLNEISVMELRLINGDLNGEGIPCLVSALRTNTILKLDLSGSKISSTSMGYLAPVFEHNQITHLNLSRNAIGDPGAKHLSHYLKHSQLKHIDVSHNGITEVGYQHLVRATGDTNVCLVRCLPHSDIRRDETATTAYKICHAFKTLVGFNPLSDAYQFVLPEEIRDFLMDDYVFFIKVLTEHPQVKAHIFNMMCFRKTEDCDCVDFDTMIKIKKFIGELSDKFNIFFNVNFLAFPARDYVEVLKKFEAMQLFDIVQNMLLHRELFYVDDNGEILHPFIYKLLYKYKMPLYNEELEPNKKNAIIAFYESYSNDPDAKELLRLLM